MQEQKHRQVYNLGLLFSLSLQLYIFLAILLFVYTLICWWRDFTSKRKTKIIGIFKIKFINGIADLQMKTCNGLISGVKHIWNNSYSNCSCIIVVGKKKPEKIRASTAFEPVTSAIPVRCSTTELWSHTLGARSICWVHISREEWNGVKYIWNLKMYCDDHSSLWSTTAVQIYESFHIYFTSFHSSWEKWTQ